MYCQKKLFGYLSIILLGTLVFVTSVSAQNKPPQIVRFVHEIAASELVEGATSYGPPHTLIPVVPILSGDELLGYGFITSDFVGTTGYSGKPIHVMVAIDLEGKLLRTELVEHSEPIVLIGIPDSKIRALTESYRGLDIVVEAAAGGSGHDLDIISGATVTIMIIDDSVVRSSIKVARILGLGGLNNDAANRGPTHELNMDEVGISDWMTMAGDGSVRRLTMDIGQINAAFDATGDEKAISRPEAGDSEDTYIEMHTALISAPSIGLSLLGEAEYNNLSERMEEGEHAILVMGRGRYSFNGNGLCARRGF